MELLTRTVVASMVIVAGIVFLVVVLHPQDLGFQFADFSPKTKPPPTEIRCRAAPLKVYMYDLPRRFNVGMLEQSREISGEVGPVDRESLPAWPQNSGLKKQHSVEYWLMASLLAEEGQFEAVRVVNGDEAEFFFVPFFSSLSFNTHGRNMTDPDTMIDRQLQEDLLNLLRSSRYWQRSGGRDHVIPMHHPNAFRFLRQQVNTSILVVADFGRYPRSLSSLAKDVVAPYVHMVDSFVDDDPPDPFSSRPTLLFFRGRTVRKDEGIVRSKLAKILKGVDGVHFEESLATGEGIKASTLGMRSSKFCLHPAGDTPSSCRLFDAVISHCVPVIVSDRIELPFEDELDYQEFCIFFSVQEALQPGLMVDQLTRVPRTRWTRMWRRLKEIAPLFEYQYPPREDDAVSMLWRQIRNKLPAVKLAVHRNRRLKLPDWWRRRR
ncbi:exostosin family protein [Wolffia australiana]